MRYTQLGRSGLEVSRLVLGTMNFGPETDEADSHAIMDAALDAGINFFDTANVYGWKPGKGCTETIIGNWLAQGGGHRDRAVLATKVFTMRSMTNDWPNDSGLSARTSGGRVEGSLTRLRTDHIDLYQMHHVDRDTPWDEIWQAIEVLVQQGKVLYSGSSNFAGWHIAQANEAAARRKFLGLVSEQCLYNLADRRVEMEVIPAARDYGVGVIPWSPLHGGLLAGGRDGRRRSGGRAAAFRADPAISRAVDAYEDAVARRGLTASEVGLTWLLTRPGITGPIVGPRTLAHLESAVRAVDLELDADLLAELDEIFPGPGPAPEAFAW